MSAAEPTAGIGASLTRLPHGASPLRAEEAAGHGEVYLSPDDVVARFRVLMDRGRH